jgi:hypothetical protein
VKSSFRKNPRLKRAIVIGQDFAAVQLCFNDSIRSFTFGSCACDHHFDRNLKAGQKPGLKAQPPTSKSFCMADIASGCMVAADMLLKVQFGE